MILLTLILIALSPLVALWLTKPLARIRTRNPFRRRTNFLALSRFTPSLTKLNPKARFFLTQ